MPRKKLSKTSGLPKSYLALAFLRLALVFVPQTGYIHPDEYFQSVEVLAGKFMELDVDAPWEFNTTFPIRSMALSYFTIGISIKALKDVNFIAKEFFSSSVLTPYSLLVVPRLLMCCLSFIVDYCVYKICVNNNEKGKSRLTLLAASYVMIVFGTRTFSNTLELILFAILLYYVSESLTFSNIIIKGREYLNYRYEKSRDATERAKFHKLRFFLKSDSIRNCWQISTVTVLGFFNRPTFLIFAFIPVFFWLYRGIGSKAIKSLVFHLRILAFILCSLPAFICVIIVDSFYYGYLTWGEIGMLDISMNNFIFTPLNFLKYNIDPKNLAQHGLHPRYLHSLVNIPLLFSVLALCAYAKIVQYVFWIARRKFHLLPTVKSIKGLMFLTFLAPVGLLSIFPHQEPRFLIPLIIPLIYLHGATVLPEVDDTVIKSSTTATKTIATQVKQSSTFLLKLWLVINLIFVIFYGFVHQGGVFPATEYISNKIALHPQMEYHIVTSHIYSLPRSLLLQKSTTKVFKSGNSKYVLKKKVFLYEYGSENLDLTLKKVSTILHATQNERQMKKGKPARLYLVIPSSLDDKVKSIVSYEDLNVLKVETFYPHLSIEAFPDMTDYCIDIYQASQCYKNELLSIYKYFVKFLQFCGLSVFEVSLSTAHL